MTDKKPWDDEPDHIEFRYKGYPCIIHRVPMPGALCGYVGVPNTHKYYGKSYSDDIVDVSVHGGLTYAATCADDGPICHKPQEGESDDIWWFGFDCAHAFDLTPSMYLMSREPTLAGFSHLYPMSQYRTVEYVTKEIKSLVDQLEAA